MKTLVTNASANYLKQGTVPRVFVSIPDANLFLGQQAYTETAGLKKTYTNSIKSSGTITQTIEPFGGMGQVSGVTVSNLELADDVSFSTTCDISPLGTPGSLGAGRTVSEGVADADYSGTTGIRNVVSGVFDTGAITVGQRYSIGSLEYSVYRGCLQFTIPDMTSLEDATLVLTGLAGTNVNFGIELYEGSWLSWEAGSIYSQFDGRSGVAAYTTGVELNESWRTEQFSTTSSNYIRFNSDGRAAILADAGSTFKLVLLSKKDVDNTAPNEDEYVRFSSNDAVLRLRYNTKTLFNQVATIYLGFAATGNSLSSLTSTSDTMQKIWTGVIDDWAIDDSTLDLSLRQNNFKKNISLPRTSITEKGFRNVPDSNIGVPISIIYGDFQKETLHKEPIGYTEIGTTGAFTGDIMGYRDYVKGRVYEKERDKINVIFSDHALKTIDNYGTISDNANTINSFVPITAMAAAVSGTSNSSVSFTLGDITHFPYILTKTSGIASINPVICKISNQIHDVFRMTNAKYTNDESLSTSALTLGGVGFAIAEFYYNNAWGQSDMFPNVAAAIRSKVDGSYTGSITLGSNFGAADVSGSYSSDGQHVFTYTLPALSTLDRTATRSFASNTDKIALNAVCVWRGYQKEITNEIYMSIQGRYDSDGTIAPINTVFENPSHVIESLARDEMSLTSAEIDTVAFDTLATNMSAWSLAFQIDDRTDSQNILAKLSEETQIILYWDENDKLTGKMFNADNSFPNQTDSDIGFVPANLDIFQDSDSISGGSFTQHSMLHTKFSQGSITDFKIEHIGMDEVKSDFKLHYRENYATGEYDKYLFINNTDNAEALLFDTNTGFNHSGISNDYIQGHYEWASIGFKKGMLIRIEGSASNDGLYTIDYIDAFNLYVDVTKDALVTETDYSDITITGYETNITESLLGNDETLDSLKQICIDALAEVKTTNTLEINANYIREEATATKYLQHLIERFSKNRLVCSFTVGLSGLAHEVGDFINIRHDRLKDLIGTATMNTKKWEIISTAFDLNGFTITIKAIEV